MRFRLVSAGLLASMSLLAARSAAQPTPVRPKITGVSHIALYAADMAAEDHYFREVVGAVKLPDPENKAGVRYAINATQYIEVLPLPQGAGINRLDHTAWKTESAEGMREYLAAKGWKTPARVERGSDGSQWFAVDDPEGNKVEFVQPPAHPAAVSAPNAIGHHIIHVGLIVHDRAAEDKFYRDLLGFRPYWWGGFDTTKKVNWISQQTPDSRDWMEYMMVDGSKGIPADMSQHDLGVNDHVSFGVVSVPETFKKLAAANRLGETHDAAPKVGLDGKYQLNMYDPDGTRVEVMNFHATEKPCCSPFTAEDPDPAE